MPLRTIKFVQIHVAIIAAMIIILHFVQNLREIFWIPPVHYVTAKNLKNGVSIYQVQYNKNSSFDNIIKATNNVVNSEFWK